MGLHALAAQVHRGLRKVACIGVAPREVQWSVPRAGQGYHHRTEMNKKVYKIGKGIANATTDAAKNNAVTEPDLTEKDINPGGWPHYALVREDYIMLKGQVIGPKKVSSRCARVSSSRPRATRRRRSRLFIDTWPSLATAASRRSRRRTSLWAWKKKIVA